MDNLNIALNNAIYALEDVIKGITRKENISPAELEHLSKTICTIERIKNIQRNDDNLDYSENSYRYGKSRTSSNHMNRENFYRGHYDNSSRQYDGNSSRYYDSSGYSGHSIQDRMIAKLEEMYDTAQSEHERQVVQDWISRLR